MLNPALKKLQDEFDTVTAEAQALIDKPDKTVEDVTKARELVAQTQTIKAQIVTLQSADSIAEELSSLKNWNDAPLNLPHVHPGAGGAASGYAASGYAADDATKTGRARLLGTERAGYADIGYEGSIKAMQQAGAGVLTPAQMKTISDPAYKSAMQELLRARGDHNFVSATARKALSEGVDTEGGQLVGIEMASQILMRQPAITEARGLATNLTTSRDNLTFNSVPYSADNRYTTGVRIRKAGERPAPGSINSGQPQFGSVRIDVHTFMMELELSNDLLEDASVDIEKFIADRYNETIDLFDEDMMFNGNGIHEPRGILHDVGAEGRVEAINLGSANAITPDGLQRLKFSIPRQYALGTGLRWAFNSVSTGAALAMLKDENKRPLWPMEAQAGLENDVPARLAGHMYHYSDFMPDVAANATPIVFGNLRGYTNLRRVGFSIKFLRELGARENQTIIIGRYRMGGDLTEPWMLRAGRIAA
jgi:HK97 family phage major capsid protein